MTSIKQLSDIANILRRDSLESTTAAGSGHPTSCLSCAEIMSVLYFHEMKYDIRNADNKDNDEFILSKGHATPILYAALLRAKAIKSHVNLKNLRKISSPLEGHPMPRSLSWIKVATGSLGQGLSVGVGMALASKLQKRKFRVFTLMGDSEVAEGSVYEAMELASYCKLNNLIAIVDLNRLGQRGETMLGHNVKAYKKRFEGFGWKTIVIDGHNIKQILNALKSSRNSKKPIIIVAKTFKGKGVSFLENKEGWHGKALSKVQLSAALSEVPNPKMPKVKVPRPSPTKNKSKKTKLNLTKYNIGDEVATRDAYGDALESLTKSNQNVLAIDGEVSNSTRAGKVKVSTPGQFVEAFIAEQNMAGMALGLSVKGFNVFASSFAAFLTRAHDQIRMAALSDPEKLTFSGSHVGVSIGQDGPSQMGLGDLALFRSLPKSYVFYPSDAISTEKLTVLASRLNGIKYLRTSRPKFPVIYKNSESFSVGNFKTVKSSNSDKVTIIGAGVTLHEALEAHNQLKNKKINTAVVDLYCVKPLNSRKLKTFIKAHGKKLVVVEDHYEEGGIGEMLADELKNSGIKIKHLAIRKIPHSGKKDELLKRYGIDSSAIVSAVKSLK